MCVLLRGLDTKSKSGQGLTQENYVQSITLHKLKLSLHLASPAYLLGQTLLQREREESKKSW